MKFNKIISFLVATFMFIKKHECATSISNSLPKEMRNTTNPLLKPTGGLGGLGGIGGTSNIEEMAAMVSKGTEGSGGLPRGSKCTGDYQCKYNMYCQTTDFPNGFCREFCARDSQCQRNEICNNEEAKCEEKSIRSDNTKGSGGDRGDFIRSRPF